MFTVRASGEAQAPLGAARYAVTAASRQMPLLAELEKGAVGWRFYKYGASSGAFAAAANREVFGSGQGWGMPGGLVPLTASVRPPLTGCRPNA